MHDRGRKLYRRAGANVSPPKCPTRSTSPSTAPHLTRRGAGDPGPSRRNWIRQFPEVRFKVFGHTDLVGSETLTTRRWACAARAGGGGLSWQPAASAGRGWRRWSPIGKTRPLIQTTGPEVRNRRTVTEVSGFVKNAPAGAERQIRRDHLARICRQRHPRRTRQTRSSHADQSRRDRLI